jgi:pyridinium-3,5-biscarboxylic acid mononucleotide synthase
VSNTEIVDILNKFKSGNIDVKSVITQLNDKRENVAEKEVFAKIDHERSQRCGFPEFVYGAGKNVEQLISIIKEIRSNDQSVLVTRLSKKIYEELKPNFPEADYDVLSKTFIIRTKKKESQPVRGKIAVVTAGTSDIPVALEAKHTAELCGCEVDSLFDVGVAGIHRLLSNIDRIRNADVIICVAGMEGALPSVVAGLVSCPVIAVPTSVGYGASLNGLTAMFAMLNSCANGVVVVNIDNGFGAGCAAVRVIDSIRKNRMTHLA